jgi:hypothetical protein
MRNVLTFALIDAASKTGPRVATFVEALIIAAFGWRTMYLLFGAREPLVAPVLDPLGAPRAEAA